MRHLAVHESTLRHIESAAGSNAHSFLLIGPSGIGKMSLSKLLAERMLDIDSLDNFPYALIISAPKDKKSISIDEVRELRHFLSLKVKSKEARNRVVIIEDAQLLSPDAQNALLKILEEPPKGTVIIMTITHAKALLPTVISRVQPLKVTRPTKETLKSVMAELFGGTSLTSFDSLYAMSGGNPGLMHALLSDSEHPLLKALDSTKEILSKPLYDRLLLVDKLSKNKDDLTDILDLLQQMSHIGLTSGNNAERWKRIYEASYDASDMLVRNVQAKLVVLNLMLNL